MTTTTPSYSQYLADSNAVAKIIEGEWAGKQWVVDWGVTESSRPQSYQRYQSWIGAKKQGKLSYLAGERGEMRSDLKKFFPEYAQAIVFLFSYADHKHLEGQWRQQLQFAQPLRVASYATAFKGRDYHHLLEAALNDLGHKLHCLAPNLQWRVAVDKHPVCDRDLAYQAGLGWFGRNSMLISPKHGSYFLIGSLLLNQKLAMKSPGAEVFRQDHCGHCTACVEVCPTSAIDGHNRTLDADRCLSTFTIETFKWAPAPTQKDFSHGYIYGCDLCQEVCPWNIKPLIFQERKQLSDPPNPVWNFFLGRPLGDLMEHLKQLSNRGYRGLLRETVFARTGRVGFLKNIMSFLSSESKSHR